MKEIHRHTAPGGKSMKLKSISNACFTLFLLGIFLGTTAASAASSPFALFQSIFDPGTNAQTGAQQGYSVAVDGNLAAVGAIYDDVGGQNSGVVKVYDATTGLLLHTLTNPGPASGGNFGAAVAISGMRVVVGAVYDDTGTRDAGSAYVFDLARATPVVPIATLTNPSPASGDFFGAAVAISGTRVIVGAPNDDTGFANAGSAYAYDLGSATPTAPTLTLTNPGPAAFEYFGFSVAISGTRVVVGAPEEAGSAYVYDLASATPSIPMLNLINPSPVRGYFFGYSVAMSGTRLVVAAPYNSAAVDTAGSAYVYDLTIATPTVPVLTLSNSGPAGIYFFGSPVAISETRVLIGAPYSSNVAAEAGSAYVYDLTSVEPGIPIITLTNPVPKGSDQFGFSVAIAGGRVVVGARGAEVAYAYDLGATAPTLPVAALNQPSPASGDIFGASVGISGSLVVIGAGSDDAGAFNAGSAYVYDLASAKRNVPAFVFTRPGPAISDYFGFSVSIDGTTAVVGAYGNNTGAPDAGTAYVYDLATSTPTVPVLTLTNPTPAADDRFGYSVGVSGTRVVVGANQASAGPGRGYIFDLTSASSAVPVFVLTNPSPARSDFFGNSVAISGDRVVIGSPQDDSGAFDSGSAYVYDLASATPGRPMLTLTNPGPAESDYFGYSVSISGARVVVGAYSDDTGRVNAGSAYVYDVTSATPGVPTLTLTNPTPVANDFFAISVAISGTRVVVGAARDDTWAYLGGSAYVYELAGATPAVPVATLNKAIPATEDIFAHAVAIDGTTVVVGAPGDDTNAADRGAAYVFGIVPELRFVPAAPGMATVSWMPAASSGFVLQCSDSLAPANWANAPSGAANPATVSTTNTARFYRLIQP